MSVSALKKDRFTMMRYSRLDYDNVTFTKNTIIHFFSLELQRLRRRVLVSPALVTLRAAQRGTWG